MSDVEASFWNSVFKNGYGEFLFKNQLSYDQLAKFSKQDGEVSSKSNTKQKLEKQALLGIGGGKDSIVAGELLKQLNIPIKGFVLATGEVLGQTQQVADVMEIPLLAIKRRLDKQIMAINKLDGAYNGHIPISLIFGLIGAISALSNNSAYVIVANEASSSIPQVHYEDSDVNHQWSKSLEFERLFQDYIHSYVSKDLHYFSAIRPMPSLAVAHTFVKYPKYFEVFTSDNSLFRINQSERTHPRWSRDSSKSLSSFILLSALLSEKELMKIFGHNFLNDPSLETSFSAIMGEDGQIVLDCVGTPEELRSSLKRASEVGVFANAVLVNYAKLRNLLENTTPYNDLQTLEQEAFPAELKTDLLQLIEEQDV